MGTDFTPRSRVWATDIDVLPADRVVLRRDGYTVVRSPSNPGHYWGNLLLFDDPPGAGDRQRWEVLFDRELAGEGVVHRTFAWDRVDGSLGDADTEFGAAGYQLERTIGLSAAPAQIVAHPRANTEVDVVRLDPSADEILWAQVLQLWAAGDDNEHPENYEDFARGRIAELRTLFAANRGGWFVALDAGRVVGSLGVVVTGDRARYQNVGTARTHRRRGVASRLVVDAARMTASAYPAVRSFVMAADPGYHALAIYESVGFQRIEAVAGACLWPGLKPPPVLSPSG